ncbi:MAG: dTDP-4-dehydrorhamnose 3,5-epimerase family protein [Acidobacteriota bacterium]
MIDGVVIKSLVTHADDRGYFREVIRSSDALFAAGFGQLGHSLVHPGITKAWHGHQRQSQWTYVASGVLRVALHDCRPDAKTYRTTHELLLGDHQAAAVYLLPPGVVHGYRCLAGPAHVIYVTSDVYDLTEEIRLPYDDPAIAYDWSPRIR